MSEKDKEKTSLKKPPKAWEDPTIVPRIRALDNTHYIFWANYQQLKGALDSLTKPEVSARVWTDENQLNMLSLHIIRLLHNYLSAAYTLRDHTYKLRDIYGDTDFGAEYEVKKNEAFADSPLAQFVQRFRNYTLHAGLPLASTSLELDNLQSFIHLNVKHLRSSGEFTGKARQYLESLGDNVRLDKIIEEHAQVVLDFYKWLHERQKDLHFGQ